MSLTTDDRYTRPSRVEGRAILTWRRLLFISGGIATLGVGSVSLVLGDIEGGIVAAGFALFT